MVKIKKSDSYDIASCDTGNVLKGLTVDQIVGKRLKLRRKIIGMSQDGLASKIGVSFQQVQKYERGANRISASRLYDISTVLGVPVSFFFHDLSSNESIHRKNKETHNFETLELVKNFWNLPENSRKDFLKLLEVMISS